MHKPEEETRSAAGAPSSSFSLDSSRTLQIYGSVKTPIRSSQEIPERSLAEMSVRGEAGTLRLVTGT